MSSRGGEFEKTCELSFDAYEKMGLASIDFMPVPTKVIGYGPTGPKLVFNGKAPFDAYGYLKRGARMIGAEFKLTNSPEVSISICQDTGAAGIAYHQLDALAKLADCEGIARIVWNNGGQIGVLKEDGIIRAYNAYNAAIIAKQRGNDVKLGSKSVRWTEFEVIEPEVIASVACYDWLRYLQLR